MASSFNESTNLKSFTVGNPAGVDTPQPKSDQPIKPTRPKGVSISIYWKFMRTGSIFIYLLICKDFANLVILTVVAQGAYVLSLWWIGAARSTISNLSNGAIVGIYIGLVMGYGLLLLISTVLLPFLSKRVVDVIGH
jgi:hypothetical protein